MCLHGAVRRYDKYEKRKSVVSLQFISVPTYSFMIVYIFSKTTLEFHQQNTTFRKLRMNIRTADIFLPSELDVSLLFVEFDRIYYFAVAQENCTKPLMISTTVSSERRCYDVRDLLNTTILQWHSLRRLKHYPQLCRERSDLLCFHDDRLMCLCTIDRFSNCFRFDFENNAACVGENPCEKEGRCFEDRPECPSSVQCICPEYYYGTRCRFSTSGLEISLDAILGYEIQPKTTMSNTSISQSRMWNLLVNTLNCFSFNCDHVHIKILLSFPYSN